MDEIDPVTLAWAAGLLEGEGHFGFYASAWIRKDGTRHRRPEIQCRMTDEDIIKTLGAVLPGSVSGPYKQGDNKPVWVWRVADVRATALMLHLRPWMGRRRRAKIDEIIAAVQAEPTFHP